jgi:hypothetical protein
MRNRPPNPTDDQRPFTGDVMGPCRNQWILCRITSSRVPFPEPAPPTA